MTLIALGLLGSSVLSAQIVPTATLTGSVSDPSGAVIPSATVQIVSAETQVAQQATSDAQGRFLFSFLQPGSYQLNVSAVGFSKYQQTGITLNVNAPATVNVHLTVQSAVADVVVNSNEEMIDTESGTLRQIVGKEYLENLPLNGRNAATLVTMAPGVVTSPGEYNDSYANSGNEVAYSVNGTYGDQVSYNLDGAPHDGCGRLREDGGLSDIVTWANGQPFTISSGQDNSPERRESRSSRPCCGNESVPPCAQFEIAGAQPVFQYLCFHRERFGHIWEFASESAEES